jgi:hypothetical protein
VIHVIRSRATPQQIDQMLQALGTYIKLAVDVKRRLLAGGGEFHADCEMALLDSGCQQDAIWGADWIPRTQQVRYEALINIRPARKNPSMRIQDEGIRGQVEEIVKELLGVP